MAVWRRMTGVKSESTCKKPACLSVYMEHEYVWVCVSGKDWDG